MRGWDIPEIDHRMVELYRWEVYNERTRKERAAKSTAAIKEKFGGKIQGR